MKFSSLSTASWAEEQSRKNSHLLCLIIDSISISASPPSNDFIYF